MAAQVPNSRIHTHFRTIPSVSNVIIFETVYMGQKIGSKYRVLVILRLDRIKIDF